MNLPAIRQIVRQVLLDEFLPDEEYDWKDDEVDEIIFQCVREISDQKPLVVVEALPTTANSKVIELSSLSGIREVKQLEYPINKVPRKFRNINWIDSETIEIDTTLTPNAGTKSTLTGTVTFTKQSAAITGSGTAFTTELESGDVIRKSTGTRWYQVYSVTDDTNLVLREPVHSEDNGADTADVTQYVNEACFVYLEKDHVINETKSTLTPQMERIVIDGAPAYLASNWVNKMRGQITLAIESITDIASTLTSVGGRLTKAVSDLNTGRDNIGYKLTEAVAALDGIEAEITRATADMTRARPLINTVTLGQNPETDYMSMAARELQVAQTKLGEARGYLDTDQPARERADYAAREMQAANTYLGQGNGYFRQLNARLQISGAISSYQAWGDRKLAVYKNEIRDLWTPKTKVRHSRS